MSQALGEGTRVSLAPPHGLREIVETFGDIFAYIQPDHTLDPRWQADALQRTSLPFPMTLSWDHSRSVTQIVCHKLLTTTFIEVFEQITGAGLGARITSFGGCFAYRPQRTGSRLSTHAWGIAIDLNSESNAQGSEGDVYTGVITIFRNAGFKWGGDWTGRARDPMHFQFCTGY